MIHIQTEDFDVAALNAELRATAGGKAGAMVTFTGYVRDQADGTATESLFLEHYPGMCEREMKRFVTRPANAGPFWIRWSYTVWANCI